VQVSNGGEIRSTGAATIDVTGVGGASVANNRGVRLEAAGVVTSVTGAITVTGTGAGSSINNFGVDLTNGSKIESTGSATIAVTGTGVGGADIEMDFLTNTIGGASAAGDILLRGLSQGISLGQTAVPPDSAVIRTTGNVTLNSVAGVVQNTGNIAAAGLRLLGGGTFTLNSTTNAVTTIAGALTSGSTVSYTDANAIQVGSVTSSPDGVAAPTTTDGLNVGTGTISLTALGGNTITQTGVGVITAGTLNLTTTSANATLDTAINAITNLGTTTLGTGALDLLNAGGLTVTGVVGATGGVTIETSGPLAINNTVDAGGNTASLTTTGGAGSTITQSAAITADTLTLTTAGANATLGSTNVLNNLGATNLGAGALTLVDAGGLTVTGAVAATGGVTINTSGALLVDDTINAGAGVLSLTATAGITQNAGDTLTGGTTTLAAGAGVITLIEANDFTGTVTLSNSGAANTVQITDANTITFAPALVLGGDFTVNSGGLITLAGITNTGVQQYNNAVSLDGTYTTNGGNFNATAATDIRAGTTTVSVGAGVATFTGAVEGPGNLAVNSSATNGETFMSAIGAVTPLASISTDAPGSVSLGGNVTTVGAQTFLDAVNAGSITLSSTGSGAISAANAASNFTGTVNISTTGTASIADGTGGLTLGTVTAGTLNATSTGGALSGGQMTVGTATFNAGANALTLTSPLNNFTGTVNLTGGATQIVDSDALTLGVLSTGALSVTSTGALNLGGGTIGGALVANSNGGAITQTSALNVAGTSNITAGAGSITLNNGGNDFGGGVTASGTGTAFADINTFTPTSVNSGTGQLVLQATNIAAGQIIGSGVGGTGMSAIVRLLSPNPVSGLDIQFPNANNIEVTGGTGPWVLTGPLVLSNPVKFAGFSPPNLVITMNGANVADINLAAQSAQSAAQATAAAAAADQAADIFGTDSVAQQVEYGFAGDVGTLPPIDHRLQGVGIRVPSCFNESREGEECSQ
jgi:hypothetical protein